MDLPRRLGLLDATTVVIGSMIGAGIFLKAGEIAQKLPSPWLAVSVWVVAGLLSMAGALSMAELSSRYPHSGGLYVFLREAYGDKMAYLFGWSLLSVMQTGSIAAIAAGVSQGIDELHHLTPFQSNAIAVGCIVFLSGVNIWSVRAVGAIQILFTVIKCGGILVLIGGGFLSTAGSLANFAPGEVPVGLAFLGAYGVCMLKALWAYDGWINATFVAGEIKEPKRNLPLALGLGTLIVMLVYVATNAAYHYVLPLAEVQQAENAATVLALHTGGAQAALLMTALVAISTFGALNSSILAGPRVYFAMARDRLIFAPLGAIHSSLLTPHFAILVQAVWSVALLALWGTFERITDNVMFIYWLFYALGGLAVFILRKKTDDEIPYRTPGYPVVPVLFVVGALGLVINTVIQSPNDSAQALGLMVIGAVFYPLLKR